MEKNHFKTKKITKIEDIETGIAGILPESSLTVQTDTHLVQFDYISKEDKKQTEIEPGCFAFQTTSSGLDLVKFELRQHNLLKTINNTSIIKSEANKFFSRLPIYEKLKRDPKRALLLCSPPGVGKTAAINDVCAELLKEEGTCVIVWDTSSIRASTINDFFLCRGVFTEKVKKFIFVIEDISGGSEEEDYSPRAQGSSLLNLLDGIGRPFGSTPTFIISTTNNPEREVGALIDRPGRFDKVVELKTTSMDENLQLLRFIMEKDDLTESEVEACKLSAKNNFSIAHIQEMYVRSLIDDIDVLEACEQLITHKERFKARFHEVKKLGINLGG